MNDQQWAQEFSEFIHLQAATVPTNLNLKVEQKMQPLLRPNPVIIFLKVFAIHLMVGLVSLAFCHQFGLNPFQTEFSLDAWFMKIGGHRFCMIACGFLFVALSLLAAYHWLTIEELKTLKKNEILQISTLSLLSLALFYFFGGEMLLGMAGLWLLGALLAGILSTHMAWKLRTL